MNFQAPKGTRDFLPDGMSIRRQIIDGLILVYKLFGFKEWDGPAFEYLETLTRKSGEEVTQEIYTFPR
jgi:histidyl-tRNA synthetase